MRTFSARFVLREFSFKLVLISMLLLVLSLSAEAQKSKTSKTPKKKTPTTQKTKVQSTPPPIAESGSEDQKVKDIISFLQFVLNTIGSSETPTREKDVLITESFSKIFRDAKVQVEDDLDAERTVITNKDVVAYLKDVDFFFKDVKFDFAIQDIKSSVLGNGNRFYKVTITRNLSGTTSDGKAINNTQPRYVEINYNPDDQDLKIVSMYTKEFDQKAALTLWWKELSYEWQSIFKQKLNLSDSVRIQDIKAITSIQDIDLTGNTYIRNIEPLGQLLDLRELTIAETNIEDITPLRNLTELESVDISNTKVYDLTPLKYSTKLKTLDLSNTAVNDLSALEKMTSLEQLTLAGTKIYDFSMLSILTSLKTLDLRNTQISHLTPIEKLPAITELDLSGTLVQDLSILKSLANISSLTLDSTRIQNLQPLESLQNLAVLSANYTNVNDLSSLAKLPKLEKIYCDQSQITREKASAFMLANPQVLVVFDSKDLKAWWSALSSDWQQALTSAAKIPSTALGSDGSLSKEALAQVTNLDSVNVNGKVNIRNLDPLQKLHKLKIVRLNKTGVSDLTPLQDHRDIRLLDIRDTEISDLFVLRQFRNLKTLYADRTKIQNIDALYGLLNLEKLYADQTTVQDIVARDYLEKNPNCLIIYKTNHVIRWWNNLSSDWKEIFHKSMGSDTTSTTENLHRLLERKEIEFKDVNIDDLSVFNEFVLLRELRFAGTSIRAIPALENFRTLKVLHASRSPLRDINSVGQLPELEELDISNTPIEDLRPLSNLQALKKFNCSGTQVKKLDALENIETLESLDCSNTFVKNLEPVAMIGLTNLKCYNTKISSKEVEKFVDKNKDCKVLYYR